MTLDDLRKLSKQDWRSLSIDVRKQAIVQMLDYVADQNNGYISIGAWDEHKLDIFPRAKNISKIWYDDRHAGSLRMLVEDLGYKFRRDTPSSHFSKTDRHVAQQAAYLDSIKQWIAEERNRGFGLQVCRQYDAIDEYGRVWTVSELR